jgi:hypothetical protein
VEEDDDEPATEDQRTDEEKSLEAVVEVWACGAADED